MTQQKIYFRLPSQLPDEYKFVFYLEKTDKIILFRKSYLFDNNCRWIDYADQKMFGRAMTYKKFLKLKPWYLGVI